MIYIPYPNMPQEMWGKMDQCVKDVMAQGKHKDNAIAICYTSLMADHNKQKKAEEAKTTKST